MPIARVLCGYGDFCHTKATFELQASWDVERGWEVVETCCQWHAGKMLDAAIANVEAGHLQAKGFRLEKMKDAEY